jgi:hypothetical protein
LFINSSVNIQLTNQYSMFYVTKFKIKKKVKYLIISIFIVHFKHCKDGQDQHT